MDYLRKRHSSMTSLRSGGPNFDYNQRNKDSQKGFMKHRKIESLDLENGKSSISYTSNHIINPRKVSMSASQNSSTRIRRKSQSQMLINHKKTSNFKKNKPENQIRLVGAKRQSSKVAFRGIRRKSVLNGKFLQLNFESKITCLLKIEWRKKNETCCLLYEEELELEKGKVSTLRTFFNHFENENIIFLVFNIYYQDLQRKCKEDVLIIQIRYI